MENCQACLPVSWLSWLLLQESLVCLSRVNFFEGMDSVHQVEKMVKMQIYSSFHEFSHFISVTALLEYLDSKSGMKSFPYDVPSQIFGHLPHSFKYFVF